MNTKRIGNQYEELAAAYLIEHGYEILERNFRTPRGELDIIALKDGVIVYTEVRYKSSPRYGDPLESVNLKKQRQVCRTALWHYTQYGAERNMPCRFDVIGIYGDRHIEHIENAFDFIQ